MAGCLMLGATTLYQASTFSGATIGTIVLPSSGTLSSKSSAYILNANPHCLLLLRQAVAWARALALERAGSSMAARIAIMAMTTRSSINVNAREIRRSPKAFNLAAIKWFDQIRLHTPGL